MGTISILIAEDHEIVRAGLRSLLSTEQDLAVVGDAGDTKELLRSVEKETPDILLLGLALPQEQILRILKDLRKQSPATRTILLMNHAAESDLLAMVRAGAKGYLLNNIPAASLKKAVRTVAEGEYWLDRKVIGNLFSEFLQVLTPPESKKTAEDLLTRREIEILKLLTQGCKNKEIAERLFISEKTVKTHLTNIFAKLKIKDRLQAALYGLRNHPEA
jgi:DNA-binding NarL/FixJ family response regulator